VTFQRVKSRFISHPTGLDVFEEDLFWTNQVNWNYGSDAPINKILSVSKFMANNSQPIDIVSKLRDVTTELHVFHDALQMKSKNVLRALLYDK